MSALPDGQRLDDGAFHPIWPGSPNTAEERKMEYQVQWLGLEFDSPGRLAEWLGPAVRGITAWQLKTSVCRHPVAERDTRWKYCRGCPHSAGCSYGLTYEPETPAGVHLSAGQADGVRPLVIAPEFPAPHDADDAVDLRVKVMGIGSEAVGRLPEVVGALQMAGANRGIGPEDARFTTTTLGVVDRGRFDPTTLPASPDETAGRVPRVWVQLQAPLFLRHKSDRGKRVSVTQPAFSDLFRASLRVIGELHRQFGSGPIAADFPALKAAAETIKMSQSHYQTFQQPRWSNRGDQPKCYESKGAVGVGVYQDVPISLIPWLVWGGRLHVGTHRVAGAGGWIVVLD